MTEQTKPIDRPPFAKWLWERGWTFREAGERLQCSYNTVRRICLPFGDTERRVPEEALLLRIIELTEGKIAAPDFYPPNLRGAAKLVLQVHQ